ncbi:MAG: ribosome-associated protein [Tenericutes bacterium ADurb.Bin087]|nr:MAG: ribosome-associated protein [Tenericutes bacterium ADurb.Bin087]
METKPYLTLQQALKKYGLVQTGGHAKFVIQNGEVKVDEVVETRRGRKLYGGETITYLKQKVVVEDVN